MLNKKYNRTKKNRSYSVEIFWIILNNFDTSYRYNIMYYSLCYCKNTMKIRDIDIIII